MKRIWGLVLLAVLIAAVLAGCGGGKGRNAVKESAKTPTAAVQGESKQVEPTAEVEPTEAPGPTAAPEPTETVSAEPTEQDLSLESRQAGLDKLKSYRVSWQSQWSSTESTEKTGWEWREEYSSNPQALHWAWTSTGEGASESGAMEIWQIGDTTYMVSKGSDGTASCMSFSSAEKSDRLDKGLFSPSLLGSLSGARFVGRETVNGIPTKHYTYDERAITLIGIGKASGETWVADDGGYVVKDVVNWEGTAGLFGKSSDAKGKGSWTWELSDVNQPIEIVPPEGCEGAAGSDLPVMPDATDKAHMGDMITYKSASAQADVVEFYKREMPAAGWQAVGEPTITEGFATLQFSKDGQQAQVMVTSENGTSTVIINVTKG